MCRLHPLPLSKEDEVMQLARKHRNLDHVSSPSFCAGRKLGELEQALLWNLLQEAPECPSRVLLDKAVEQHLVITVSIRHLNQWRAAWGLNRGKGRPGQADGYLPVACGAEVVRVMPPVSCVGVHVFAHWLEQHDTFGPVVAQLQEAIAAHKQAHAGDDFALLHHCEVTLKRRFAALFLAPLLGIGRLSEFDSREHPLKTLLGRGYQSSTLHQFLAQLERLEAGKFLLAVWSQKQRGSMIYVDGHMIAYWSRRSMHKGKITMRGRIMAGSQAVIAHEDRGQAVFVAYYPPDMHVSQVMVAYCEQVAQGTGRALFVLDRAVNCVALARAFDDKGLGLMCMLDDNEHRGVGSFEATRVDTLEDGTKVYRGAWKECRHDDPRHFVIVEPPADKTLVYWGTPKMQEALAVSEWPGVYRERNAIQELSFKGMIDHGGLDIN
jgi:hypothetical protein